MRSIDWQWKKHAELTANELEQVFSLRQQVFIVEQNCPYQDIDGEDQSALHLMGWYKSAVVAYLRLFPRYPKYDGDLSFGRVCSAQSVRGTGIGRLLMTEVMNYIDHHYPNKTTTISAQQYLEKFYQDFGFETCSEMYLEDDIPHIKMSRLAS